MATEKEVEFEAAIRGYHFYRKVWEPEENETLICLHEEDNPFDIFAIKTCRADGTTVGHLPREISRASKFLLDRGADMTAKLTSTDYRRSPLVQGGIEIPCKVIVKMRATRKNIEILEKYLEIIRAVYEEPELPVILGSFLSHDLEFGPVSDVHIHKKKEKRKKSSKEGSTKPVVASLDIRSFFKKEKTVSSSAKKAKSDNVILLLD